MTVDVQARYLRALTQPSDIVDHLPTLHGAAATAATVIELGVRRGVSSVAFLAGLPAGGRLHSVDVNRAPFVHPSWEFIQGDDLDPAVIAQLPPACDVLFIDTSHTYSHTLDELATWAPTVRSGGVILLHDTELAHPDASPPSDPPFPVARALDDYCQSIGWAWTNTTGCYGLGRIDVP